MNSFKINIMKQKLIWKKEYEVGDYEVDAEHQIFLKIIQKIDNAFTEVSDNAYILRLLNELFKYAVFHFASEENRMLYFKYTDYETHKQEHEKLLVGLNNEIGILDIKFIDQEKLIKFLFNWFIEHTTSSDIKFGNYLNNIKTEL